MGFVLATLITMTMTLGHALGANPIAYLVAVALVVALTVLVAYVIVTETTRIPPAPNTHPSTMGIDHDRKAA